MVAEVGGGVVGVFSIRFEMDGRDPHVEHFERVPSWTWVWSSAARWAGRVPAGVLRYLRTPERLTVATVRGTTVNARSTHASVVEPFQVRGGLADWVRVVDRPDVPAAGPWPALACCDVRVWAEREAVRARAAGRAWPIRLSRDAVDARDRGPTSLELVVRADTTVADFLRSAALAFHPHVAEPRAVLAVSTLGTDVGRVSLARPDGGWVNALVDPATTVSELGGHTWRVASGWDRGL